MGISFWQIAIVVVLVVLLFGRGKISDLMGDVAKGIKSFKSGLADDSDETKTIDQSSGETATVAKSEDKQTS
jgi:sec-independent protein translocase protein TatA